MQVLKHCHCQGNLKRGGTSPKTYPKTNLRVSDGELTETRPSLCAGLWHKVCIVHVSFWVFFLDHLSSSAQIMCFMARHNKLTLGCRCPSLGTDQGKCWGKCRFHWQSVLAVPWVPPHCSAVLCVHTEHGGTEWLTAWQTSGPWVHCPCPLSITEFLTLLLSLRFLPGSQPSFKNILKWVKLY